MSPPPPPSTSGPSPLASHLYLPLIISTARSVVCVNVAIAKLILLLADVVCLWRITVFLFSCLNLIIFFFYFDVRQYIFCSYMLNVNGQLTCALTCFLCTRVRMSDSTDDSCTAIAARVRGLVSVCLSFSVPLCPSCYSVHHFLPLSRVMLLSITHSVASLQLVSRLGLANIIPLF